MKRGMRHDRSLVGVKGVDLGEAILVFARDKIVLAAKQSTEHLTLHLGANSRVLDIHRTRILQDGSKQHTTLFSISHSQLAAMLDELVAPVMNSFTRCFRPMPLGFLSTPLVSAVIGLHSAGPALSAITKVHRRRLSIDRDRLARQVRVPESLSELFHLQSGEIFTLFSCLRGHKPRKIGFGFPVRHRRAQPRLVWVRERRLSEMTKAVGLLLSDAARRYGTFHSTTD
jgi:hypothetical protein